MQIGKPASRRVKKAAFGIHEIISLVSHFKPCFSAAISGFYNFYGKTGVFSQKALLTAVDSQLCQ